GTRSQDLVEQRNREAVVLVVRALRHDLVDNVDPALVVGDPLRDARAEFLTLACLCRRKHLHSVENHGDSLPPNRRRNRRAELMSKENSETPPAASESLEPWATLTLESLASGDPSEGSTADAALVDAFDALGALLAELGEVGGVETRDPALIGASVQRPELVVYLRPEQLEAVEVLALRYAQGMGLELRATGRVRTDDDWRDSWKRFYQPMLFGGGSLLLRPSWVERRADDPECELVIDPGRAFGTGLHESTRLCLELSLSRAAAGFAPARVLDLGCGSGILGLAMAR